MAQEAETRDPALNGLNPATESGAMQARAARSEPVAATAATLLSGPRPAVRTRDSGSETGTTGRTPPCEHARSGAGNGTCEVCGQTFANSLSLSELSVGKPDKVGNTVLEVYCATSAYKVYRTARGVFVHFADCGRLETMQRAGFDALYGPLCSMRFLTSRMFRFGDRSSSFYDHEIAQAIIQALNGRVELAVKSLNELVTVASDRVANENRVRYLLACLGTGFALGGVGAIAFYFLFTGAGKELLGGDRLKVAAYILAAMMGGLGAVFSIAMSVRSLEIMPCQQSFMNYVIGAVRVLTGFVSGAVLILLLTSDLIGGLGREIVNPEASGDAGLVATSPAWAKVALLGLIAGFAERLVPDLITGASSRLSSYREKTADIAESAAKERNDPKDPINLKDPKDPQTGKPVAVI